MIAPVLTFFTSQPDVYRARRAYSAQKNSPAHRAFPGVRPTDVVRSLLFLCYHVSFCPSAGIRGACEALPERIV